MRIEKSFTSNHRLREWLESKSWEFGSTEMFYVWLEQFFEDGNRVSVKGAACDYHDCIDVFEAGNDE